MNTAITAGTCGASALDVSTRRLDLLPLDDRTTLPTKGFGQNGIPSVEQSAQIATARQLLYDGFKAAVAAGVRKENAGIVVDERFDALILRDAVARGYTVLYPLEKGGQDFAGYIEAFQPTLCRVRVRYNPSGDPALNQRQAPRLRQLSRYLHEKSQTKFMLELRVPPQRLQLEQVQGSTKAYQLWLRPRLIVEAIEQIQDAGVEPDVWNIEGLDQRADGEKIVAAARRNGRTKVACIVGASGEDENSVRKWLTVAARVRGFIGFAVSHADFSEALFCWRDKKMTRAEAVSWISARYRQLVNTFERTEPLAV